MLEDLVKEWSPSLSWEECGALCDRMTETRTRLRQSKGIKNPQMWCRECNEVQEMTLAPLTIRSMLFALRKQGRLSDDETAYLDKAWQRYRRKTRLDGCAKELAEPSTPADGPEPRRSL